MNDYKLISHEKLTSFIHSVFLNLGFSEETAMKGAENLVKADLRGIDSHGAARLSGFVRLAKKGRINTNAQPKIIHETLSTATLDADGALGLWVADMAMEIAMNKAKKCGSGWVAVQNSSHFGIAGAHSEKAVLHDMIGLAMTNASPLVAPAHALKAYLGTNPISMAVPVANHLPFLLDMATAAAANGKLEIAQRKDKKIPTGWLQTVHGNTSDNPHELKDGGTLHPLGSDSDHGWHKGYGLGAMVDILTGVLSGANFGLWVPPFVSFLEPLADLPGKGIGHFVGAWRIDAFQPAEVFKQKMQQWVEGVKGLPKANGYDEILIPGEPEYRMEKERQENGIPLILKVWDDLKKLSTELGLEELDSN